MAHVHPWRSSRLLDVGLAVALVLGLKLFATTLVISETIRIYSCMYSRPLL